MHFGEMYFRKYRACLWNGSQKVEKWEKAVETFLAYNLPVAMAIRNMHRISVAEEKNDS